MAAYLLDTETNIGPTQGTPEVIELAFIALEHDLDKVKKLTPANRGIYYCLDNFYLPEVPISIEALAVHHITPNNLEVKLSEQGERRLSKDAHLDLPSNMFYMVGHNIDFDYGVLGKPEGIKLIDTLTLARKLWPELSSHNQNTLMFYVESLKTNPDFAYVIELQQNAHSALYDILNLSIILEVIVKRMISEFGCKNWEDIYNLCEEWRVPTHFTFGLHKGKAFNEVPVDYLKWMLKQDFDKYTLVAVNRALGKA